MSEQDHTDSAKPTIQTTSNAPTWKYVVAWIAMSVVTKILSLLIGQMFEPSPAMSQNEVVGYFQILLFTDPLVTFCGTVAIFYLIYFMLFTSLNTKKVLPWMYWLGSFGTMASLGQAIGALEPLKTILSSSFMSTYVFANLAAWVLALIVIRRLVFKKHASAEPKQSKWGRTDPF